MLELLGHIFSTIQKFMGDCPQFDDMTAAILHYSGSRHEEYVSRQ
jgi:serine phosphatase RsbU (regulator of sigma subunit)